MPEPQDIRPPKQTRPAQQSQDQQMQLIRIPAADHDSRQQQIPYAYNPQIPHTYSLPIPYAFNPQILQFHMHILRIIQILLQFQNLHKNRNNVVVHRNRY